MSKFTKQQLEEIYNKTKSITKTAKELNCTYGTVKFWLQKYEISFELEKKRVDISEEDLKRIYLEKQSVREVAEYFGVSHESIRDLLHKYDACNIPIRYKCNKNFFSVDSEAGFYLAGFIAADGNIKDQGPTDILGIALSREDRSHLEKIKELLKADNPIHDYLVKNSKRNPKWNDTWKSELAISCQKYSDDLKRFNVGPRKTFTLTFPDWMINHPMVNHFMRGYFDGDGSFYIPCLAKNKFTKQLYFSLRGTSEFLTSFRNILEQKCLLEERKTKIRISNGCGILEYGGNDVLNKIYKFLYKDATIYLQRKYDLISDVCYKQQIKQEIKIINQKLKEQINFRKNSYTWLSKGHEKLTTENLINLYEKHGTLRKTAKLVNKRTETVRNLIVDTGKQLNNTLNLNKNELQNLYKKYGTIEGVAAELGHTSETIKKYMHQHGLEWSKTCAWTHQHDFFSVEKECSEQFYWAGYLLGNSTIDGDNIIISSTSKESLENLIKTGMTGSPINTYKDMYRVSFVSAKIVKDLERFNIFSDKKLKYSMPEWLVNHQYLNHFLRGRIEVRVILSDTLKSLELTGPIEYLEQVRDVFVKKCGLISYPKIGTRTGKNSNRMTFTGNSIKPIKPIKNYLYK